jgi:O-antigen/teichoic acid export membrane protein
MTPDRTITPQHPPTPAASGTAATGTAHEVRGGTRGGLIGLAGAMVSGLFGFVLTTVITRAYGTAGAGAFFTVIGLVTVTAAISCLGADTALIWALPRRLASASANGGGSGAQRGVGGNEADGNGTGGGKAGRARVAALIPAAVLPPLVVAVLMAGAGIGVAGWLAPQVLDRAGTDGVSLLRAGFVALPVVVAMTLLLSVLRALRPIGSYVAVQFLLLPIGRPVLVGAVALAGGGLLAGVTGWLLPAAVAAVACVVLVAAPLRHANRSTLPTATRESGWWPGRADWRVVWGFALPRAGSAVIDASSMWVGVLLTAVLAGQQQAGVFGAVGRYVLAGQLAMQGFRVAVAPQLSRLVGAGQVDAAAALHRRTTTWVIALSWPVYLLLAGFGPGFLRLFGGGFGAGGAALAVLSVAMLVNVGCGNVQTLLLMSGRSGLHLAATVTGLATNLVAGALLIPRYGALGAAISWSAGIVLENVLATAAARHILHRPLWITAPTASGWLHSPLGAAGGVLAAVGMAGAIGMVVGGRGLVGLGVALGVLVVGIGVALSRARVRAAVRDVVAVLRPGRA